MTTVQGAVSGRDARVTATPIVEAEGWAKALRWVVGGAELVAVGLALPLAILVVGAPLAWALQFLFGLLGLS